MQNGNSENSPAHISGIILNSGRQAAEENDTFGIIRCRFGLKRLMKMMNGQRTE